MKKPIRQGPREPDPIDELRDEVGSLRSAVKKLAQTVRKDHKWFKRMLKEILLQVELK